jgi:hypothetical protein
MIEPLEGIHRPGKLLGFASAALEARMAMDPNPTWTRWTEIPTVVFHVTYLKRTLRASLTVGSILFAINHLDAVLEARVDWRVWTKGLLTCLVPFCVSNWGILVASRRPAS